MKCKVVTLKKTLKFRSHDKVNDLRAVKKYISESIY